MPRSSSLSVLFWLLACTPGVIPGGSDGETDTETIGTGTETIGTGTGTIGTGTDTGGSGQPSSSSTADDTGEPPPALECESARWVYVEPMTSSASPIYLDSRGHALVLGSGQQYDFDPTGGVVVTSAPGLQDHFGGLSGEDHWYLTWTQMQGVSPRKWLRKFDLTGALIWERDLGPTNEGFPLVKAAVVGPDGSTVVSEKGDGDAGRLIKHDADGALVWDVALPAIVDVKAMSATGTMAALVPVAGMLSVLGPDAATLWQYPWKYSHVSAAAFDASGAVVFATQVEDVVHVGRFEADGTLAWETYLDGSFIGLAVNAAGEVAVGGYLGNEPPFQAIAYKLDVAGATVATRRCTPDSWNTRVAIDDAGTMYLAGAVDGDSYHLFVAAVD